MAPHEDLLRFGKAAWQLEDALGDRLVKEYPSDPAARETYFQVARAEGRFRKALWLMLTLTVIETPSWCQTSEGFFENRGPEERCTIPGVPQENILLSTVPYVSPGVGVVIECCLMVFIAHKLLLERRLQEKYFSGLGVQYVSMDVVRLGLAMLAFELVDMLVFLYYRPGMRLAFVARTGYLCLLPGVRSLLRCIWAVMGEFLSIAAFLMAAIVFFSWVVVTIFADLNEKVEGVPVNKGLDTFTNTLNTMFVAGISEDFVDCFLTAYTKYRWSGFLWLTFLVLVQVLFLSLVLDTLVAQYTTHSEETEEVFIKEKVKGILNAFGTLSEATGEEELSRRTFSHFAQEFGRSPRTRHISTRTADIMFAAVDKSGSDLIDRQEFCEICGVMQYDFWVTRKDSCLKRLFPSFWKSRCFSWLRDRIDPEDGTFDWCINMVLFVNLGLVVIESVYDLNDWDESPVMEDLELTFSFIYLLEVLLRLCVYSWKEYWSSRANQFDFFTTWALLVSATFTTAIEEFGGGADVKRYVNILRLLRLLRMAKQLKRVKAVQFMVDTIVKLVAASKDILALLGVVIFFFTALSVQLWGGLLYVGNPKLEETEYAESKYYAFNYNDCFMAFGAWVVMLLCEYAPQFPEVIALTSDIPGSWWVFPVFYVCGVSIVFELVKAFTIELFIHLNKKRGAKEEELVALKDLQIDLQEAGETLHYRMVGDVMTKEKMDEVLKDMLEEEEAKNGEEEKGAAEKD